MDTVLQDFLYALRQLRKSPGFTATAVVSLALGIGATTAVFSVIYAILMNPYAYAHSDRMVHMRLKDPSGQERYFGLTTGQWQEIRKSPVVEDAFLEDGWNLTITGQDLPEDVAACLMSSNSFEFLSVPTALGRGLQSSDAIDGQEAQAVAVLSYKFWQKRFNSNPRIVGQNIQLVRKNYTIVGVAGPRFTWEDADVYLPQKVTQDPIHAFYVGLRLKPGISHEAANAALSPLIAQFALQTPKHFPSTKFQFRVAGLNEDFVHDMGGTLSLLFCAVALLLAIGCGNVSILLLARGTARQQEFAVRSAIGATRRRLIRQLLTEAVLLSVTGAIFGVLLAYQSLAAIVAMLPKYSFPHEAAIRVDLPVLIFSVAVAIGTGILFGLWPALQLSRPELSQVIQSGTRRIAGGGRGRVTNNILIAGQIALTLVMLTGAGAAMEGFLRLLHTRLGYDPHNVMSVGIPVHENTYKTWAERSTYFAQIRDRVAAVPGVAEAAISSNATPPSNGFSAGVEILGRSQQDEQKVRINLVSQSYFSVLRIPFIQGAVWDETQNRNAAKVAVINETMAHLYFPKGDALGHSFRVPDVKDEPPFNLAAPGADGWLQIVGIIADKRDDGLRKPILPEAFVPWTLSMRMYTQILVRSEVSPLSLLHAIGLQISAIDPDQQMAGNVEDLEHWITDQQDYEREHLVTWLFGAFAVLALALAAVGLYSVVSYSVVQRTNEFGIRTALGAPRLHIWQIVFASMGISVGSGIAAGVLLTIGLNRVLARWAEGSARDPLLLLAVTVLLALVAALACAGPARRASAVDPMTALRFE
jgi:putative ABC transport system permease protein